MDEVTKLNALRKELGSKVFRLEKELNEARKDLAAVDRSIRLLNPASNFTVEDRNLSVEVAELQGKEIVDALLLIAERNRGILRSRTARRLLEQAELLPGGQRSSNILWNAIVGSNRFEQVRRGEYRLREESWEPEDRERPA